MSKQVLKQVSPLTSVWVDEEDKKQTSIEWLVEQLKPAITLQEKYINEFLQQAKAMHQQEIEEAYDRKVIGDIQNWYIRNGKHYYELHYKEEQVGE